MNTPLLCAHLSNLAYEDVTLDDLRPLGMTWLQVIENGASYAFLCGDGRRIFITHRGTNDTQDWMWDVRFGKVDFPYGGRVHRGFKMAHDKIWPGIWEHLGKLDPSWPIIADGHSLGGSMTQLTAAHLCSLGRPPEQCHTFGSPKVGNDDFVSLITCPVDRWEAFLDPVTMIPFRWGPIQAIWALAHGRAPSMFDWPEGAQHDVDSRFHSMDGYLEAMEAV